MLVIPLYFLAASFMNFACMFPICINSFHKEFEIGWETEKILINSRQMLKCFTFSLSFKNSFFLINPPRESIASISTD